jgi:predicted DNA-binding transcriptional regulator AlpA
MTVEMTNAAARASFEPLLTHEDLEQLLRVDRRTIRRLCLKGELPPPLKLGGQNRWRAEEINEAIEVMAVERIWPGEQEMTLVEAV